MFVWRGAPCRSRVVPIRRVDDERKSHNHGAVRVIAESVSSMMTHFGDVAHIVVVSVVTHMWMTGQYTCRLSPYIYVSITTRLACVSCSDVDAPHVASEDGLGNRGVYSARICRRSVIAWTIMSFELLPRDRSAIDLTRQSYSLNLFISSAERGSGSSLHCFGFV